MQGCAFPNVGGLLELPKNGFAEFGDAAAPFDFGPTGGVGDFPSVGASQAGHPNDRQVQAQVVVDEPPVVGDDGFPSTNVFVGFRDRNDDPTDGFLGFAENVHFRGSDWAGGIAHHEENTRVSGLQEGGFHGLLVQATDAGGVDQGDAGETVAAQGNFGGAGQFGLQVSAGLGAGLGDPLVEVVGVHGLAFRTADQRHLGVFGGFVPTLNVHPNGGTSAGEHVDRQEVAVADERIHER